MTFFPDYYVFQDVTTGRIVGSAKGLYYLEAKGTSIHTYHSGKCEQVKEIWLHHLWHGHPYFMSLKTVFQSLL